MPKENNKMQVDIDTLKKQNVNDLLSIKELYKRIEELGEKITQIKYIDNTIVKKIKKEYEKLNKIILDENIQVELTNKINEIIPQMETNKKEINLNTNNIESRCINVKYPPKGFSGAKGDGKTDDTQALKNIFDSLKDGDTLYFPKGEYKTTSTLTIKKAIKLQMQGTIVAHHSVTTLLFKNDEVQGNFSNNKSDINFLDCEINVTRDSVNGDKTNPTAIGVEVWNAFYPRFLFKKVTENYIGVKLKAEKYGTGYSAITYGSFFITLLNNYYCNLYLEAGNDGFVTQNQFYGGSFSGGYLPNNMPKDSIHIFLNNIGNSVINENTFFSCSLEGHMKTAIKGYKMTGNKFISLRYEMPKIEKLVDFDNCRFNILKESQYICNPMREGKFNITTLNNNKTPHNTLIQFIDYKLGLVTYYDGIFYVTPNQNKDGTYSSYANGISEVNIPTSWEEVEIQKSGFSDVFMYANANNVTDGVLSISCCYNDKYVISEQTEYSSIKLKKPPKHSKEIILDFRGTTSKDITITNDTSISAIIDKTGNYKTIPIGTSFVKLFYRYHNNQIFILNIY